VPDAFDGKEVLDVDGQGDLEIGVVGFAVDRGAHEVQTEEHGEEWAEGHWREDGFGGWGGLGGGGGGGRGWGGGGARSDGEAGGSFFDFGFLLTQRGNSKCSMQRAVISKVPLLDGTAAAGVQVTGKKRRIGSEGQGVRARPRLRRVRTIDGILLH